MWVDNSIHWHGIGERGFLILREKLGENGWKQKLVLKFPAKILENPGVKFFGYCYTMNDIRVEAHGMAEIVELSQDGRKARIRKLKGQELVEALEARGYDGFEDQFDD